MKDSSIEYSISKEDERFKIAVDLFNSKNWYRAHDVFEEIWHETSGPERSTIQAFLQTAVAQLHLENGNINGATILFGEALGRLKKLGSPHLGLDIKKLSNCLEINLDCLHQKFSLEKFCTPYLSELDPGGA